MISFSLCIIVDGELLHFLFTNVLHPTCTKYFIAVRGRMMSAFFKIKKTGLHEWKILPLAPSWVLLHEKQLTGLVECKINGCTGLDSPIDFNPSPQAAVQ